MDASATVETSGSALVIRAVGEFDISTAPTLSAALQEATAQERDVILDLDGATFVDVTCLGLIVDAQVAQAASYRLFTLRGASEGIRRVARVLELDQLLSSIP